MRRRTVIGPVAKREIAEAMDYYRAQGKHLPKRLRMQLDAAIRRIRRSPFAGTLVREPDVRKIRTAVFSYLIYYRVFKDNIRIISVFHSSRDPSTWHQTADDDIASSEPE